MADTNHRQCGDTAAVHIRVIAQHARRGNVQGGILIRAVCVPHCHRGIVYGLDRNGHCCRVGVEDSIVRLVSKAVGAVPVPVGCIGERPIAIQRHCTVRRTGHKRTRQAVSVYVGVIPQHARCGYDQWGVLVHHEVGVGGCRRGIIHRIHCNRDRGYVGVQLTIMSLVRESIHTVPVLIRDIIKRSLGIQCECSAAWTGHQYGRESIIVRIRVVAQHPCIPYVQWRVFVHAIGVVCGHGRIIAGKNGDRDRLGIGQRGRPVVCH